MTTIPLVSVIIPVYNAERYVRGAIDSILAQTFTDFELLIIDDGSTDGSLAIVRSYRDPRIRVLAEAHCGLVHVRNKGVMEARGEYIAWMDADDLCVPARLEKQVAYLHAHFETVMVGSWARVIDAQGRAKGLHRIVPTHGRQLHVSLCAANQFVNGSTMMRKDAVLLVGGYRQGFAPAEDYDLSLRLAEIGGLANIAESLYRLRIHENSATARTGQRGVASRASTARHAALDRRLFGYDSVDYAAPRRADVTAKLRSPSSAGASAVALSDWAQIALWQGQVRLALRVLRHAVLRQDDDAMAWSIVPPNSFSTVYAREVLHAVRHGRGRELARAKVRRIYTRIAESYNGHS